MKNAIRIAPLLIAFSVCFSQRIDIQGRIVDNGGSPVKEAEVKLIKARLSTHTDDQGRFHIQGGREEPSNLLPDPSLGKIYLHGGVLFFPVPEAWQEVKIEVFDRMGRKVNEVFKARAGRGNYSVNVFPETLPIMIYIIKLRIGSTTRFYKAVNLQATHGRSYAVIQTEVNPLSKQAYTAAKAVDYMEVSKKGYMAKTVDVPSYKTSLSDIVLTKAKSSDPGKGLPPVKNGKQATTTRYWDCCKPHCAWSSNMKLCDISGNVMHNRGAKSGCDGGSAFQCFDYAPIEVNRRVSYGWAAFNNRGTNCGDCFQLDFKGSLNGKHMIVQVVNIGDGGKDAFDLLIPGGGVGKKNGCSKQWGNPPLGERYGGFHSTCKNKARCILDMCKKAFGDKADLMRGCEWYVDWFKMSSNPRVVYKKVSCPQEIRNVSGIGN